MVVCMVTVRPGKMPIDLGVTILDFKVTEDKKVIRMVPSISRP